MPMDRRNYDAKWLEPDEPGTYSSFEHRPAKEIADSRPSVMPALAAAVLDHHTHEDRLKDWIDRLGFPQTKQKLDELLDFTHETRMGNFGEVVASEHLIQRYGYEMPIFKLRYRDSKLPMRGEDVVAFRRDAGGAIDLVVLGEAKALMEFGAPHYNGTKTVKDALKRLTDCYTPHPNTLDMIVEILYGAGRKDEALAIEMAKEQIVAGSMAREHWIVLLTGDAPNDPFRCIEATAPASPPLICVNLPLTDFKTVVEAVFHSSSSLGEPGAS